MPTNPLNTSRWKKLRDHLVHDHSACALCGATPGRHLLDLDHITPRAHGGDLLRGAALDWLLQYAPGDYGIVENARFQAVYRPV